MRSQMWWRMPVLATLSSLLSYVPLHAGDLLGMNDQVELLVILRDASTRNLVKDAKLTVAAAELNSTTYHGSSGCESATEGIFRVWLSRGKFRLLLSAKGYHPVMVDEGVVLTGNSGMTGSGTGGDELRFVARAFIYTVRMESRQGQPAKWRIQKFLSDTVYYREPETPPEPVGGMRTLKRKVANLLPAGSPGGPSMFVAVTSIEKDGHVSNVDMTLDVPPRVRKAIAEAVGSTPFTPAKILGTPVKSRVFIPFELSMVW